MPCRIVPVLLLILCVPAPALSAPAKPEVRPKPTPSTSDAIVTAIRTVGGRIAFGAPVVVEGRQEDQTVTVTFSSPASSVIVKDGRKAVNALATVEFKGEAVRVQWHGPSVRTVPAKSLAAERAALASAAAAAYTHLSGKEFTKGRFTYPTSLEVKVQRTGRGFSVFVQTIPYTPGGHSAVELSPELAVRGVMRGA